MQSADIAVTAHPSQQDQRVYRITLRGQIGHPVAAPPTLGSAVSLMGLNIA